MKIKDTNLYLSKARQKHLIELSLIKSAHKYGWSRIKTSRALQEGLMKISIRLRASTQSDVYHLTFNGSFTDEHLKVDYPILFDQHYADRFNYLE